MKHQRLAVTVFEYFEEDNCLSWDFPGGPVVKNLPANAGDVGSIPGQGDKPHKPQLRVHMPHLKILHAITKTQLSQISKYLLFFNEGKTKYNLGPFLGSVSWQLEVPLQ